MNGQTTSVAASDLKLAKTTSNLEADQPPSDLNLAKAEAVEKLLHPNGNIVGLGIGKKVTKGKETPEDCVRVYVVYKIIDPNGLAPDSLVPPYFGNHVPTDVIEVGRFGRRGQPPKPADTILQQGSPIRVKTNAPNVNEGARGTLGTVVAEGANRYILSCNHILARNGRIPKSARVVSAQFVGTQQEIALPGHFVNLDNYDANSVDCALALLTEEAKAKVQATFPDGSKLSASDPADSTRGMRVRKFGAVTGRTEGAIVDTDVDLYIDYSFGTFLFTDQVMIDSGGDDNQFATAGDSGSIVIDQSTNRATAMVFAASGRFAVACRLDKVLAALAAEAKVPKLDLVI